MAEEEKTYSRGRLQHSMLVVWGLSLLLAFILSGIHYIDIFQHLPTSADPRFSQNEYLKKIAFNILNNILGVYLPIAAVMLTSFFSASDEYRRQKIAAELVRAAVAMFTVVQLVTLAYVTFFVFLSNDLEAANMPVIQNAAGR